MAVESIGFTSESTSGRQGFAAYRDFYQAATNVSRSPTPFYADVSVIRVPRMVIFKRRISGVRHVRGEDNLKRDGFDHITLHVLVSGQLVGGPHGRENSIRPGEIMVVDTARPYLSQMDGALVCSVQLARDHVRQIVPNVDRVHGLVLPETTAGLLSDYILSFTRRAATLPPHIADRAAETAVELFGLAMSGAAPLSRETDDTLRRMRAEVFVAGHLADPHLDADAIAAGVKTSRSALYRTFEADGGVARYVQRRRLEGLRRALLRSPEDHSLASISRAYGFVSESHCSRAFAAAFGKPPKRYRGDVRSARQAVALDSPAAVIMRWATELY